ncbi:glycosyltransferase, partial [Planctomycetota bacterium]
MDIITELPGRYCRGWDECMRQVPPRSRLVTLEQAIASSASYDCIIAHNIPDLLDIKTRTEPRILMLHLSLPARLVEERTQVDAESYSAMLRTFLNYTQAHAVAVTPFKGNTWGVPHDVVQAGVEVNEFLPHTGALACGLRICNFMQRRRQFVYWDFYQKTFAGLRVRLVGHNPEIPGSKPTCDGHHLQRLLSSHRFFIHTADPRLEDGFNMAVLEAMAAGLPILGNNHPTSPVEHGVSGFLSDDPVELRGYAQQLLRDRYLAQRMGQAAQARVQAVFPRQRFCRGMERAIMHAKAKHGDRSRITDVLPVALARMPIADPLKKSPVSIGLATGAP